MDEDGIAAAVADGGAATSTAAAAAAAAGDDIDDDTVVDAEGTEGIVEADDDYQYADHSRFERSDE